MALKIDVFEPDPILADTEFDWLTEYWPYSGLPAITLIRTGSLVAMNPARTGVIAIAAPPADDAAAENTYGVVAITPEIGQTGLTVVVHGALAASRVCYCDAGRTPANAFTRYALRRLGLHLRIVAPAGPFAP